MQLGFPTGGTITREKAAVGRTNYRARFDVASTTRGSLGANAIRFARIIIIIVSLAMYTNLKSNLVTKKRREEIRTKELLLAFPFSFIHEER